MELPHLGITVEHLHPLHDHSGDLRLFIAAHGQVLESILTAVLSKADGVRDCVSVPARHGHQGG